MVPPVTAVEVVQPHRSAGDLVFFGQGGNVSHVGIYVGEGRFVHAPSRGKDVQVSELDGGYWSQKFIEARRVDGI